VADRTGSGRSEPKGQGLYAASMTRKGLSLLVVVFVALTLGGVIGGYLIGLKLAQNELASAKLQVDKMQPENQKLKRQTSEQNAQYAVLQAKLASAEAALKAIMPAENTYNINPNQSIMVAAGRLTVGMVGSPSNDSVNLNINGKQQTVATGDVVKIGLDAATACRVEVLSFDMFKALVSASCAAAKPQ